MRGKRDFENGLYEDYNDQVYLEDTIDYTESDKLFVFVLRRN